MKLAVKWMKIVKIILNEVIKIQKDKHSIYVDISHRVKDNNKATHKPREAK